MVSFLRTPHEAEYFRGVGPAITDKVLAELGRSKQLRTVIVEGPITGTGLESWHGLKSLRHFNLICFSRWGPVELSESGGNAIGGLKRLRSLSVTNSGLRDTHLARMEGLKDLEELHLDKNYISGTSLSVLGKLPVLRVASFQYCMINDRHVSSAAGSTSLQSLQLSGNQLGDSTLRRLAASGFPNLKSLFLNCTDVTDDGLDAIADFRSLEHLEVRQTRITAGKIDRLISCEKLSALDLRMTAIDDSGLRQLSKLDSVTWLLLDRTDLTDTAVPIIAEMRQLKFVALGETNVSDQGIAELRKRLPDCQVAGDESLFERPMFQNPL